MKVSAALACLAASAGLVVAQEEEWPLHDNGLTELVQWDHHSYHVNGERLFIFSGEFHPWRFPVPELWRDLLEKVKAAGFNAFSIYTSWGYHNPSPGVLDFSTGAHNITSIMTLAKELGMYVIVRPGPYVNAETNAGGFPLWLTTGAYGALRDDDERYTEAWTPYWEEISAIVSPHLITNGGNVIMFQIENELNGQWSDIDDRVLYPPIANYMQLLQDSAIESGIDVPLAHNAPNMNGYSWSEDFEPGATGNVDVVGLDSYPSCWSCNLSECTGTNGNYIPYQTIEYFTYFTVQSPSQPNFMPEFQGGSYNPWGGPRGGCPADIGADFANLFYRDLIYQRVTAISLYMLYGGTNWGWSACPVVATSYDYSSPVSEDRSIGSKYYETKLLTLFTRAASSQLSYTERVGNGTHYSTNDAITVAELRNLESDGAFYVARHSVSSSGTTESFRLRVSTSEGDLTIPRLGNAITIDGHQAKILVTDFPFGEHTLLYSTAEILSYAVIDGEEILALWLPEGEAGEFSIKGGDRTVKLPEGALSRSARVETQEDRLIVSYVQTAGMSTITVDDSLRVLLLDRQSAYHFWVPTLDADPFAPVDKTIMVQGPYLVRSAEYDAKKKSLHLTGDEDEASSMTVFAPRHLCSIWWNGKKTTIESSTKGMYVVTLDGPGDFELPALGPWKVADSLPEIVPGYAPDSAAWVVANNTETPNPTKPDSSNPVLYVDDYDIHTGNHIYHATFSSTASPPTGIDLDLIGGLAFGYSAWLNGDYIGSYYGLSYEGSMATRLSFSNATLSAKGAENTLVVLMDNSGHDLRDLAIDPRGITNATLLGDGTYTFFEWRIAGTAGRDTNIDPVRGPHNEGGLYAERIGLHLPGASEDSFEDHPAGPLVVPSSGVHVFRTTAPLDVPTGLDVSISFRLTSTSDPDFTPSDPAHSNRLRALLFVNGYQYGRFNPHIGHQIDFPVPPGVLNYRGDNTIAVTVWSQDAAGVEVAVDWQVQYVHATSFDMGFESGELRPDWDEERLVYA